MVQRSCRSNGHIAKQLFLVGKSDVRVIIENYETATGFEWLR